jgi:hypothetical protein
MQTWSKRCGGCRFIGFCSDSYDEDIKFTYVSKHGSMSATVTGYCNYEQPRNFHSFKNVNFYVLKEDVMGDKRN